MATMMISPPKDYWDLETILSKIRCQDAKQQELAALHLKEHAKKEREIRTSKVCARVRRARVRVCVQKIIWRGGDGRGSLDRPVAREALPI